MCFVNEINNKCNYNNEKLFYMNSDYFKNPGSLFPTSRQFKHGHPRKKNLISELFFSEVD